MKVLITFILCLFVGQGYSQDSTILKYEKQSDTLVFKLKEKKITDDEKKELKKIAFIIQNYGQNLGDSKGEYKSSLKYINKAIELFTNLRDTLSQANNKKFKGYLLGMLGEYPEAKAETQAAIKLYTLKNVFSGVAVSQFDLCRVYDHEQKIDSAIYYCNLSLNFWKSANNTWRIFNVETMLIHLLTKSKKYDSANFTLKECEKIIENKEIEPRDLSDFYLVLIQLYTVTNQKNLEKLYQKKLNEIEPKAGEYISYYQAS